jgi:hypothetical protein
MRGQVIKYVTMRLRPLPMSAGLLWHSRYEGCRNSPLLRYFITGGSEVVGEGLVI